MGLSSPREVEMVNADCLEHMRTMGGASIDAVITDPPYGLSFMGKRWDTFGSDSRQPGDEGYHANDVPQARCGARYGYGARLRDSMAAYQERMTPVFAEALRVCRPGAHLLCFGGTRTFHRMACAVEDAGWEVRDCIMWVYGSGFPKSMDVSKAIDKRLGATREVVGRSDRGSGPWNIKLANHGPGDTGIGMMDGSGRSFDVTVPATDDAREWEGWGTCLKPAWEPVIVARKPLAGTVAENVLAHGTGAINVDACRVPCGPDGTAGRFPANLAHDGSPEVMALFPQSKGQQGALRGTEPSRTGEHGIYGRFKDGRAPCEPRGDAGSAARFFYCAKASRRERGEGNDHPTVKPLALMEWLVKMVTREGQLVLDPFAGSGTTLLACANLGRRCVGVERDPHYCDVARSRLADLSCTRR